MTGSLDQNQSNFADLEIIVILRSEYAGENFVRFTGDTVSQAAAQVFAWEAASRGLDVHLLAEPTKLQMLQRQYQEKKDHFKTEVSVDYILKS